MDLLFCDWDVESEISQQIFTHKWLQIKTAVQITTI